MSNASIDVNFVALVGIDANLDKEVDSEMQRERGTPDIFARMDYPRKSKIVYDAQILEKLGVVSASNLIDTRIEKIRKNQKFNVVIDQAIAEFHGHEHAVSCLIFASDKLISASFDHTIRTWNIKVGLNL